MVQAGLKSTLRNSALSRPLYGLARNGYVGLRGCLYRVVRTAMELPARATGVKTFHWNGFTLVETWRDAYKAAALLGGLKQFEHQARMVARLCPPAPVVFDVGAHIGMFSLPCSRIPGSRVFGFEPVAATFSLLGTNVERNHRTNVKPCPFGLAEETGDMVMRTSAGKVDSGDFSVSLTDFAEDRRESGETASFMTLDAFMAGSGAPERVDFIKIRIQGQGHEAGILRGGWRTIERHRPAIYLSFNARHYAQHGLSLDIYLRLARELGYALFRIIDVNARLERVDPEAFFADRSRNVTYLVFVPAARVKDA